MHIIIKASTLYMYAYMHACMQAQHCKYNIRCISLVPFKVGSISAVPFSKYEEKDLIKSVIAIGDNFLSEIISNYIKKMKENISEMSSNVNF